VDYLFLDTEDNSIECLENQRQEIINPATGSVWSGMDRTITQIAAVSETGEEFSFDSVEEFTSFISYQKPKIYAHNLSYDLGSLYGDRLHHFDMIFVGGRLIKATGYGCTWLDSANIYPMPLKKVGEAVGLKKLDLDINSRQYVFTDCHIVRIAIQKFKDFLESKGSRLKNTLGGCAVDLYKTRFKADAPYCDDMQLREAYYGGRTELFRSSYEGQVQYVDINSLYPYCMTKAYPDILLPVTKPNFANFGIASVEIYLPETLKLGVLPYRTSEGINYPLGYLKGVWTYLEIEEALKRGAKIIDVEWAEETTNCKSYYKAFMLMLYKERLKAKNEADRLILKLLMNNLYGQLGMSGEITRLRNLTDRDFDIAEGRGNAYLDWQAKHPHKVPAQYFIDNPVLHNCKILAKQEIPLPDHVNYSHAAYVTSYARIELLKWIEKIGVDRMLYCDTDSCIFTGDLNIPVSTELGGMKHEGEFRFYEAIQPKVYQLKKADGTAYFKTKGIKNEKAKYRKTEESKVTTSEQFYYDGETALDQPYRMKESINLYSKGEVVASRWRKVEKSIKTSYTKKNKKGKKYIPKVLTAEGGFA
jgi:hypothetical protein